jgi:hypothetical protein
MLDGFESPSVEGRLATLVSASRSTGVPSSTSAGSPPDLGIQRTDISATTFGRAWARKRSATPNALRVAIPPSRASSRSSPRRASRRVGIGRGSPGTTPRSLASSDGTRSSPSWKAAPSTGREKTKAKLSQPERLAWAELVKRVYPEDVLACPCGGRRRGLAMVFDPVSIERVLRHPGLPHERPARAPPRMVQAELGFCD